MVGRGSLQGNALWLKTASAWLLPPFHGTIYTIDFLIFPELSELSI